MFSFKLGFYADIVFTGVHNERNQFFGFVFMMVSLKVSFDDLSR